MTTMNYILPIYHFICSLIDLLLLEYKYRLLLYYFISSIVYLRYRGNKTKEQLHTVLCLGSNLT